MFPIRHYTFLDLIKKQDRKHNPKNIKHSYTKQLKAVDFSKKIWYTIAIEFIARGKNMKLIKLGFTSKYTEESIERIFLDGEDFLNNCISDFNGDVCHYFPTNKLKNILEDQKLLFSDVEFLNDSQEESNIFLILKELLESQSMQEIHPKLIHCLSKFEELRTLTDNEIVYHSFRDIEDDNKFIYNSRRYIFCASKDIDCLAMWKYYSKGERYDALNIVFSPNDLINCVISDLKEIQNGLRILHGL